MIYGPKSRDTTGYSRNAGSNSMDKFMSRHITILGLQSFPWDSKHKSAVTILVDGTIETVIRNLVFSSTSIAAVLSFKSLGNDCKPRIPHSHLSISWWFSDMVYNLSCPVSGQSLSCVLSESFQRVETLQDITAQQQTTKRETFWPRKSLFYQTSWTVLDESWRSLSWYVNSVSDSAWRVNQSLIRTRDMKKKEVPKQEYSQTLHMVVTS